MALRRSSRLTPRVDRLQSLSTPHHDPPISSRGPAASRWISESRFQCQRVPDRNAEPRRSQEIIDLLRAIQRQDQPSIYRAFLKWTDALAVENPPPVEDPLATQDIDSLPPNVQDVDSILGPAGVPPRTNDAQALSGPTFSEILRSLDPLLSPEHDMAHGLNLSQGETQFVPLSRVVDYTGVRIQHRRILSGMQTLLDVRSRSPHSLSAADYEVLLRCAGAAIDHLAAKRFFNAMAVAGQQDLRTVKTWSEFIKARFMTEPAYYQFDRARVVVLARDRLRNWNPFDDGKTERMDRIRYGVNALKKQPWNRKEGEWETDLRRTMRVRSAYPGYKGHWIRLLYYGHEMDEELACTSMVAFARSSSLHAIKELILKPYYGITIEQNADEPGHTDVSGGNDFAPASPLKPTTRLLDAIVEAFGAMSHIPLGLKLVDHLSRRYDLPIPHETWSNILNWTYVCASKPVQSYRKIQGAYSSTRVAAADTRQIWQVMMSEPYNVQPTFEDYDVYIKTLILQRSYGVAVQTIRGAAMPYYDQLVDEYTRAVYDEVLLNDIKPSPTAAHRRQKLQLRKDHTHHLISTWFTRLLKAISSHKSSRSGAATHTLIPHLLGSFPTFFTPTIRYRTAQGQVELTQPNVVERVQWERNFRTTLPQKRGSWEIEDLENVHEDGREWPTVERMRVLEWKRTPEQRLGWLGRMPEKESDEGGEWWRKLEEEMVS